MCGIFGWLVGDNADIERKKYVEGLEELFRLSETRGKEASGICVVNDRQAVVYKECIRARQFIKKDNFFQALRLIDSPNCYMAMGHARMITNGSANDNNNNQPVVRNNLICIHNGIIVNDQEIWDANSDMKRAEEVDTEVFLALLEKYNYQDDMEMAFQKSLSEIQGSLSIALVDRASECILLYTNIGSLYIAHSKDARMLLFASERYILEQVIQRKKLEKYFDTDSIRQVKAKEGFWVNYHDCTLQRLFDEKVGEICEQLPTEREYTLLSLPEHHVKMQSMKVYENRFSEVEKLLWVDENKIGALRRCTKCLLPETFPGISFDKKGECSICKAYKKKELKGTEELRKVLNEKKRTESYYDCIVPLSGGRDSCYMLHYIVKELGLRPVAYTYDWGMVTDLARRNIQRMCSALEVEHILISADIAKKRKNVQMNVSAWLKHPSLVTVPLFMAGDKQFFYYAQLLKRQMKVDNIIFGMNSLEETQFKVRFAGMKETGKDGIHYNLSAKNKYNLFMRYAREFLQNPAYINRSLLDSFSGFISYYLLPKDYVQLFDYIPWNQSVVEDVILNQYHWEKATGTDETWRIGDGTAPFYNYIYYKMAGFTEFDTFKSNQIREGILDRETALASLEESNRVSVEAFIWYCDTIQIDPIEALKIINRQKKLYDR